MSCKVFGTSKLSEVAPETSFVSRLPRLNPFFFFSDCHVLTSPHTGIPDPLNVFLAQIFSKEFGIRMSDSEHRTANNGRRKFHSWSIQMPNRSRTLEEVQKHFGAK